jgi:hypothetical protein
MLLRARERLAVGGRHLHTVNVTQPVQRVFEIAALDNVFAGVDTPA